MEKVRGVDESIALEAADCDIWEAAIKSAERSTINLFKTGAVIFDGPLILSTGCSHTPIRNDYPGLSLHAEDHALRNSKVLDTRFSSILIVTLGRSGNFARSSRPCLNCAKRIVSGGIDWAMWPERLNNGAWVINRERSENLLTRSISSVQSR